MGPARHPNRTELSALPAALRRTTVPEHVRAWVKLQTGADVKATVRLEGATSAAVHRVDLTDGRRVVVRRYVWRGFVDSEPDAPAREASALEVAHRHHLRVPELIAADPTGDWVGDGVPLILMTFLAGRPLSDPDPHRLAEAAAAIHAVEATDFGYDYFPWLEAAGMPPPSTRSPLWEESIDLWHRAMPPYRPVLIHRDFHPSNLLWWRRTLSGVVDWANGCQGPAGCDVATCESNLANWAGREAADAFVDAYEEVTGDELHPFWQMARLLETDERGRTPENLVDRELELARIVSLLK